MSFQGFDCWLVNLAPSETRVFHKALRETIGMIRNVIISDFVAIVGMVV